MLMLFRKGSRGFAACHDGKYYFPDRKSSINCEGVWDCKITVDREKYAFVVGTKVDVPSLADTKYQLYSIMRRLKSGHATISRLRGTTIGRDELIFVEYNNSYFEIGYVEESKIVPVVSFNYTQVGMVNCYKHLQVCEGWNKIESDFVLESLYYFNDPIRLAVLALAHLRSMRTSDEISSVTVYGNRIVKIVIDGVFGRSYFYGYDSVACKIVDASACDYDRFPVVHLDLKAVKDWAIKNRVACVYCSDYNGDLAKVSVECFGQEVTIACAYANSVVDHIDNFTDEQKQEIAASFERLLRVRKHIGKNVSVKSTSELAELSKLSDCQVLGWNTV